MKSKISMKEVSKNWKYVFSAGYCELFYIMDNVEPDAYNSGIYGWNCDIYFNYMHDIAISTGYRNMRGKMIPHELIEKYSSIAKEIVSKPFATPYEETKKALDANRENFFAELMNL